MMLARAGLISFLVLCGVTHNAGAQSGKHPSGRYIVPSTGSPVRLALGRRSAPAPAWLPRERDVRGVSIGVLDGPIEYTFGRIEDVLMDSEDRIYVLDSHFKNVRIFSAAGKILGSFGGNGQGPGEFRRPMTLALDDGRVFVGDLGYRLATFRMKSPGAVTPDETIQVRTSPHDVCVEDSLIVVHGSSPGQNTFVSVMDLHGELRAAFGEQYRSTNQLINYQMSAGQLACFLSANLIVFAPANLPIIRGYSIAGKELWTVEISDFRTSTTETREDGGYEVKVPAEGFHRLHSIVPLSDDRILVQYAFVTAKSEERGREFEFLQTLIIDARSGKAQSLGRGLAAVAAANDRYLVTKWSMPYPHIRVVSLDGALDAQTTR